MSPDVNDPGYRAVTLMICVLHETTSEAFDGGSDLLLVETILTL
jgi:hypothetical protein